MIPSGGTVIGRVQLRGSDDSDQPFRVRRALEALDIRPRGLAPGAILCVRRLSTNGFGLAGGDRSHSAAWGDAISYRLAEIASHAVAPADGPVPATAQAVIFRDRAEMLACLALDFAQPDGTRAWWWQEIVRDGRGREAALHWQSGIVHVPAAVATLRRRRVLGRAFSSLSEGDAQAVLTALWRAYALPAGLTGSDPRPSLSAATEARGRFGGDGAVTRPVAEDLIPSPHTDRDGPRGRQAVAKPYRTGLSAAHDALATTALTLHDAPADARSPAFLELIDSVRAGGQSTGRRRLPEDYPPAGRSSDKTMPRARRSVRRAAPAAPEQTDALKPHRSTAAEAAVPATPSDEPTKAPVSAPFESVAPVVETRLGGVFYLLNLGLYLRLYADFTRPNDGHDRVDPWTFVARLARSLTTEADSTDPVWALLDHLAQPRGGREGAHSPALDWRMPAEWLLPFRGWRGEWRWSRIKGRLRIDHPAGFRVVDLVDVNSLDPRAALRGLGVRPRLKPVPASQLIRLTDRSTLARWHELVAIYARARLCLALGMEPASDQLIEVLLRHQGRVHVTASAVDVDFSLASLPLEIRRAGLDRDIGWLPAVGRYITFHYE